MGHACSSRAFTSGVGRPGAVTTCLLLLAVALLPVVVASAGEEEAGFLIVEVQQGQTLRGIAEEYLADPDLWEEILKVNGLSSPTEARVGTRLRIPKTQVSLANLALAGAQTRIHEAGAAGAKVFAPDLLSRAVQLRDQALGRRRAGDWSAARNAADQSAQAAGSALKKTQAARDASGQAVLSNRAGKVQRRRPSDLAWVDSATGDLLVEQEKVRTLSESQAEVLFVDESRLRLGASSQAVIQRMRVDPLTSRQDASVSLVEGDLFALLGGSAKSKQLEVAAAGVATDSRSTDFWMSRTGTTTRVANYDDTEMVVSSGGGAVTLGKNEGAVVRGQAAPERHGLLAAPNLRSPEDDEAVEPGEVGLAWEAISGATKYRVEVAEDPSFRGLVASRTTAQSTAAGSYALWWVAHRTETAWQTPEAEGGGDAYYWRVAAIDDAGFPGAKSSPRRVRVRRQTSAPFLAISSPRDGDILRSSPALLAGVVGSGCTLTVDGQSVEVAEEDTFAAPRPLLEGENTVLLVATDPRGGTSSRQLRLVFMPDKDAAVLFDPALPTVGEATFVTRQDTFTVLGRTQPGARVEVLGDDGVRLGGTVATSSDGEIEGTEMQIGAERVDLSASGNQAVPGEFRVTVPARGERQEFVLRVTMASGHATEHRFAVVKDDQPPLITLLEEPPRATREVVLKLAGTVTGASEVLLDGSRLELEGDSFEREVELAPGANRIELEARDLAGNQAGLERRVVLDRDPPALGKVAISETSVGSTRLAEVVVEARDDAELARSAEAALAVGDRSLPGTLVLDRASGRYTGRFPLPADARGKVVLRFVILSDRLGNRTTYRF